MAGESGLARGGCHERRPHGTGADIENGSDDAPSPSTVDPHGFGGFAPEHSVYSVDVWLEADHGRAAVNRDGPADGRSAAAADQPQAPSTRFKWSWGRGCGAGVEWSRGWG